MKITDFRKLLANSELACVSRGPDLVASKDHLLIYHPNLVDELTEKDLRKAKTITDRVLWFGAEGRYCFLMYDKEPIPSITVFRIWRISLIEDRVKLLDRINRLNKETTIQKVTLSEKPKRRPGSKDQSISGTISVSVPVPANGITLEDVELIIKRLLVVPVEDKIFGRKGRSRVSSTEGSQDLAVSFDRNRDFVFSKKSS
jgi:hypothetical protein